MLSFRKKLSKNKPLEILLSTNAITLLAAGMLGPIYALFVNEIGGDILDASFAGAVFALATGITVLVSGRFSDKMKESEYVMIGGYMLIALGFFLLMFVYNIWTLLMVQMLIGIGEAIYSPAFDGIYTKHMNPNNASNSWGAWKAMNYFVTAIAAALGGYIVLNYGFHLLFLIMFTLVLFNVMYLLFLSRKTL